MNRATVLLERGDPIETVVGVLRAEGFGLIESMSALIKAGVLYDDARTAVIDGPVWADHRDKISTDRWVVPPERPDEQALERLRDACRTETRITEVWIAGSHFTRSYGSSDVRTTIALILDPPLGDMPDEAERDEQVEIMTKLGAAWSSTSWTWVTREIIEAQKEHCEPVYFRDEAR